MRRMMPALALLLLMSWGCGDTTTTDFCTFDSDCPSEGARFCVNGICRSEECREDRDCSDGQTCVEGVCSDG